jgi:hypothetical protein
MVRNDQGSGDPPQDKDLEKMRSDTEDTASARRNAHIDPRVQNEIGKHLRAIYDDVINEPVPSKFMELLEKLERSTTQKR